MVFCFVQNFFSGQHKSQNIYFFVARKAQFFSQKLTLGYMTKTLNHIIFFSSTKIRIFFSNNIGNQNGFFQKIKWSVPNQMYIFLYLGRSESVFLYCLYLHHIEHPFIKGGIPFTGRGVIVVIMIVWQLDLQQHVQSVSNTTKVASSNPVRG